MHIDADSLVLNLNQPLDRFLSGRDVQLHIHESGEVTASTYMVRNSVYGRCFLRYWSRFRASDANALGRHDNLRYNTLNYDNGDLMAAVMNVASPRGFLSCLSRVASLPDQQLSKLSNPYLQLHVECWKRMLERRHDRDSLSFVPDPGRSDAVAAGLQLYLPREGYWRTFARRGRFGAWWDRLFGSCQRSSDIIGHGWKAMARELWGGNHSCPLRISSIEDGLNEACQWLSEAEELLAARQYCLWRSPVCKTSGSSENRCVGDTYSCTQLGSSFSSVSYPENGETLLNEVRRFDVGDELWWRQQLCSWCLPTTYHSLERE